MRVQQEEKALSSGTLVLFYVGESKVYRIGVDGWSSLKVAGVRL